jgi:hypothetical protein
MSSNHFIIFSHGFGVKKDSRGLFPEIAHTLNEFEPIFFDYNIVNEEKGELRIQEFSKQVQILENIINKIKAEYPNAVIDIISHSQGAVIVGLLKPFGIRKTVLIAPPYSSKIDKMLKNFTSRAGTIIDFENDSKLMRSDGSISIVPKEYWIERSEVGDLCQIYNDLGKTTELSIIRALDDEVLDVDVVQKVQTAKTINLNGDHNFSGESRVLLLNELQRQFYPSWHCPRFMVI